MDQAERDALRQHFEECPLPPDAGCDRCHAYEKARRLWCHGFIKPCRIAHLTRAGKRGG